MAKKVTVYDIAEELGISASTVSRVLNNSSLISDERSREIRKTAEKLGYQKRVIRKHVTRAILNLHLFLPKTDNQLIHFFYNISELIESVQQGFGDVRLNFVTRVNDGNLDFLERKKTGQIDGCLFAFTSPSSSLRRELNERAIPFLLLNRRARSGNFVCYDIPGGIHLLAQSMYDRLGDKIRPCFLGFRKLPRVSKERFDAAGAFFRGRGVPFSEEDMLVLDDLAEIPRGAVDWVMERDCNAVLAFNDLVALSFLQSGLARGIDFPSGLMLCGFDDSPLQSLLDRRIDTVRLSIPELGLRAGRWLKSCIIEKSPEPLREVLPVDYIPGETIHSRTDL